MKRISAILKVYNEEKLLPAVIENIEPHVDEIVVVDGSALGASTDRTKEIAVACDKVVYESGTFKTLDGAWDMATQGNTAIANATGDILLFVSADMLFVGLEHFRETVQGSSGRIFFFTTLEFWRDTHHLRLYSPDTDVLTVPSSILEPAAIDRTLNPYYEENGAFNLDDASLEDRVILPQTIRFHLGWIRPFKQQVDKHIRHVKQHRWGDQGEKLLRGGERGLEQWAIKQVLDYEGSPSIAFSGDLPIAMAKLKGMKSNDGADAVLGAFKQRYGISPFNK